MKKLRIFVSSPGDVGREREAAAGVVARLQAEFSRSLEIEAYFWDHEPMHAGTDFQSQIPSPADFQIFVGILWSRLGTRLNSRYTRRDGTHFQSGTEYEFEAALEAYRQSEQKTPRLLIYNRVETPSFPAEPHEELERRSQQWTALQDFIKRFFQDAADGGTIRAAKKDYRHTGEFEDFLADHLRKVIRELAPDELAKALADPGGALPASISWTAGSPYRGLKAFEYKHAAVFFGRTQAIDQVIGLLSARANDERCPFVVIFGSSGSGKSSLLRAGVIPALVGGGVGGVGLWRRGLMRPSQSAGDLFDGLAAALLQPDAVPELAAGGRTADDLAAMLRHNSDGIGLLLAGTLPQLAESNYRTEMARLEQEARNCEAAGRPADAEPVRQLMQDLCYPEPRLILGLDQLEEMFTQEERFPATQRDAFLGALASLLRVKYVWIVATLRSDFFARCEAHPELVRLKAGKGQFHLLPPSATELSRMIRLPAQAAGVAFEDHPVHGRLDDALREAAIDDPGALPLLEFALKQLFAMRGGNRVLTHKHYAELGGAHGGLRGVLVQRADRIYAKLSPAGVAAFPAIFKRLATIDAEGTQAGRLRFSRRQVPEPPIGQSGEREVREAFLRARLLVADADDGGEKFITVAHEALLNEWPHLRELLEREVDYLRMRGRVAGAAAEWERENRNPQRLAAGLPLAEARAVGAGEAGHLGAGESEYIRLSIGKNRRRLVLLTSAAACLLLVFAALTFWAELAAHEAAARKRETQRVLSSTDFARANELFGGSEAPGGLAFLARAADGNSDVARAAADRLWFALTERSWPLPLSAPMQHGDAILAASFSPDGTRVLTASSDGTARFWDAATGQPLGEPMRHAKAVDCALFSPDGRYVLTACFDGTARLWSAATALPIPGWLAQHDDAIGAVVFGPSGHWVATGSRDGSVRVWDVATGTRLGEFSPGENVHTLAADPLDDNLLLAVSGDVASLWNVHDQSLVREWRQAGQINAASFSPDGNEVLLAGSAPGAQVRATATGLPVCPAFAQEAQITDARFSPDGKLVATLSAGQVFLWKANGSPSRQGALATSAAVSRVRFSRDGLRILTGSTDGAVQAWNTRTGERIGEPIRASGQIIVIDPSPDDVRTLVATADGAARVWRAASVPAGAERLSHPGAVESMALAADGKLLLTACSDGHARLWDTRRRTHAATPLEARSAVVCVALSADGKFALTGGADGAACVWSVATGEEVGAPLGNASTVCRVAFNPEGGSFATATESGVAQLWELPTLKSLGQPMRHQDRITALRFNAEGAQLATSSWDATARVWNAATGAPVTPPLRAEKEMTDVAFSPDGKFVATASRDGTAQLWDVATGRARGQPWRHKAAVEAVAFSPDGRSLATASDDGTAAIWDVATGQSRSENLRHAFAVCAVCFSPDSERVATASEDGTARLWDPATGQALSEPLVHGKRVNAVLFSPDGRSLFTASSDDTARVWDVGTGLTTGDDSRLAGFAREFSSETLSDSGRLAWRIVPAFSSLRQSSSAPVGTPLHAFYDWFFADCLSRQLTPYAGISVPDHIHELIAEGTPSALDTAALLGTGDARVQTQVRQSRFVNVP